YRRRTGQLALAQLHAPGALLCIGCAGGDSVFYHPVPFPSRDSGADRYFHDRVRGPGTAGPVFFGGPARVPRLVFGPAAAGLDILPPQTDGRLRLKSALAGGSFLSFLPPRSRV